MLKVLSVFGTRPEAIKMAPVVRELARNPATFFVKVCVTGQHRQMLDQVLQLFQITPDYDLEIMRPNQSLCALTSVVLQRLSPIFAAEQPDWVLVQGDTTTAMAGSLAAFYHHIPVAHIEAGLRTYDNRQPFPEELNRRVTAVLSDLHFAPTEWAAANLRRECVPRDHIVVTGNTGIDSLHQVLAHPYEPRGTALADLPIGSKRLILVTAHRRENFGDGMNEIAKGLQIIARTHSDVHIVCPMHPNPNAHGPLRQSLANLPNITLLPPLDYQPLVWLLKHCHFVITDSGGLQEEAPGLGKPVLVLRQTTERPEGVEAGAVRLIGANATALVFWAGRLLDEPDVYARMARTVCPYGDGHAAERIATALRRAQPLVPASPIANSPARTYPVAAMPLEEISARVSVKSA